MKRLTLYWIQFNNIFNPIVNFNNLFVVLHCLWKPRCQIILNTTKRKERREEGKKGRERDGRINEGKEERKKKGREELRREGQRRGGKEGGRARALPGLYVFCYVTLPSWQAQILLLQRFTNHPLTNLVSAAMRLQLINQLLVSF